MAERKLGFEGLVEAGEEDTTGYTVNFSATERESPETGVQEEITLIDTVDSSSRSELTASEKVRHCAAATLGHSLTEALLVRCSTLVV